MPTQLNHKLPWSLTKLLVFRFFFLYVFLSCFPFPLSYIPFGVGDFIQQITDGFWKGLTPIFAQIIGYDDKISFKPSGSGDTTFHYLILFGNFLFVFFGTLLWSILDRKAKKYPKLWAILWVYIRYFLAVTMLVYGFAKVFINQFGAPGLIDLIEPLGNSSPMGLLWKFFGASKAYTFFGGFMEVIAGILLLFRSTTLLGALCTAGIMLNVFVLNMTYDVPVKLFSFHLLLLSILLLLVDSKRLYQFFITNANVVRKEYPNFYTSKSHKKWGYVVKYIFIGTVCFSLISSGLEGQKSYGMYKPKPPLYGIYEVTSFEKNQKEILPLKTHPFRWDKLVMDKYSRAVFKMDGKKVYLDAKIDTIQQKMQLKSFNQEEYPYQLHYQLKGTQLLLEGTYFNEPVKIRLKKLDPDQFILRNRGFHWINEYPMNR